MRATWFVIAAIGCGGNPANPGGSDGGGDDDGGNAACETKAPWASAPPLALGPTQETAVVAVDDRVYILGGFAGATITDAVQIFDTTTCTYSMGPALPRPVHHANATALDGTIYVTGSLVGGNFMAIGDTWSWNPATETDWTVRASMPAGTQRGTSVTGAIDGKIFVAGGFRGNAVLDVSFYDPALDTWTVQAAMPETRDHGCGGAVGGKLYVTGGRQGTITSNNPAVFEFTPNGGWVTRAPMPTGRGGTGCGVIADRIIVVGGEGNRMSSTGVFPQVEAYTPATDTWETLAPMPTPRHGMGAAVVGNRLYVPGGATQQGFGAVATHEILTP